MADTLEALEAAAWAAADGSATPEQLTLLEADPNRWRDVVEDLLEDLEDRLDSVRQLTGPERNQVVADFEAELAQLEAAYDLLSKTDDPIAAIAAADPAGEVRLQASWASGQIVVWAAGPGTEPASAEELSDRLEAIGGPAVGWSVHPAVVLPGGARAAALAIPIGEALGWLVAVGGGLGREGVGASVAWLGRVAVAAVRLVARGAIVPTLPGAKQPDGRAIELGVKWVPALVEEAAVAAMAAAMPGPVTVLAHADPRNVTLAVQGAVVDTIVRQAAGMLEFPAPPPVVRTTAAVAEAFVTRLDGSTFEAPVAAGAEVSKRIDRWAKPLTGTARVKLVITLDPPDSGNAWFLSVLGPGAEGTLLPIEQALADGKSTKPLADELNRVERVFPALLRPGALRRGQVYLSQDEAWELMTVTGPLLEAAGFELRVPALSRKKPSPSLRLFAESMGGESVVGAHQLANVSWSVLFDDVELTAEDVARLAAEARPLVRSHGKWVELDAVDLKEAAAALAERAEKTKMTGAEILRHSVGLEGNHLAGGVTVDGSGWASELFRKASHISTDPITTPEGFVGELRGYQAEALAWLGFLHTVDLGGCLALDMGLGKTPTMLAHLGRTTGEGTALVIAPPAVVGNWAREAAKFVPHVKVLVHHGAGRASGMQMQTAFDRADVVITTYGTAVRDMDALSGRHWTQVVLDEAQAIKNHTSETAQQLRRLDAGTRVALTGTPIENGLGDLWAILDFTNPGLVGNRAGFISQMQGEGEAALRALNGILVFRRTKSEPEVAAELPDRIDELDHCMMTPEQIGLYQAVLDGLVADSSEVGGGEPKQGAILAAITALKQICNHPSAYQADDLPLSGRSGKLTRLEEIVDQVFAGDEKVLIFTHFAEWGKRMADHLSQRTGQKIDCYHGGLARGARDRMIQEFQERAGAGALVLSLKAGGTGLNLTAANHVVLYDRWWNPAVEDQARDRAWRIGQTKTVVSHRLVCPGTVDERVEEVVAGKRHIADLILPGSSSLADLDANQLRVALGLRDDELLTEDDSDIYEAEAEAPGSASAPAQGVLL
ncbi:MAG TPA: DEAD/DEAH box helicase [Acidimicrobiales bacterium]|nr:DEAD/DEAH box helicase [Acidimicrobiales bacterium]